jgi:hypothetical protein
MDHFSQPTPSVPNPPLLGFSKKPYSDSAKS